MDEAKTIETYINKYGQTITLHQNEEEISYRAIINELWKKNKTKFEGVWSMAGVVYDDYCLYYGPASVDISQMGDDDYFVIQNNKFELIKFSRVVVDDKTQYFAGVIKKIREEEDEYIRQD